MRRLLRRVGQALPELTPAALQRPIGNQLAQARARSGVGVLVLRDVQPFGARLLDVGQHPVGLAPGGRPGQLDVRNLGADARLARDAEDLVERLVDLVVLVPHVAGVDAVVRRDDLGQLDNLIGLGEHARLVDQAGRKPDRAVLHGLLDQRFHLGQFLRRGRAVEGAAHGLFADGVVADERGHVHGDIGAARPRERASRRPASNRRSCRPRSVVTPMRTKFSARGISATSSAWV